MATIIEASEDDLVALVESAGDDRRSRMMAIIALGARLAAEVAAGVFIAETGRPDSTPEQTQAVIDAVLAVELEEAELFREIDSELADRLKIAVAETTRVTIEGCRDVLRGEREPTATKH